VVLDAKRGDVGSTAEAYARAYLAPDAPLRADALTVNPYLGGDTLLPFVEAAQAGEAGLFVLVKTSNPGSGDVQDATVAGERPLYVRVAEMLAPLARRLRGPETEWSGLGAVVGGMWAEPAREVREALPRSLFLVPGYGAQGASVRDALAGFVPGPDGRLEGGLVSSSRAVIFPAGGHTDDAARWERSLDAALDLAASDLAEVVASR
jgi:orotidine-5'-phosphate decarboxylase